MIEKIEEVQELPRFKRSKPHTKSVSIIHSIPDTPNSSNEFLLFPEDKSLKDLPKIHQHNHSNIKIIQQDEPSHIQPLKEFDSFKKHRQLNERHQIEMMWNNRSKRREKSNVSKSSSRANSLILEVKIP